MVKFSFLRVFLFALGLSVGVAFAQPTVGPGGLGAGPGLTPGVPASGGTFTGPTNLNGGGNITNLGFYVAPNTIAIGAPGTGYAAGDMVTLACPGAAFSVAPVVAVTTVSVGVPASIALSMPRATTSTANAGTVTCTQASTTGSGLGLTVRLQFTPQNPDIAVMQLTNGGGVNNGNTFINSDTISTTYAGAEGTFFGDKAGGAFSGFAIANSAFGHNACGINYTDISGATVPTGSFNTCLGDDAGRDVNGAAASNTLLGQSAGRVVSGNSNTIIGEAAASGLSTANNNTIVGQQAGGSGAITGTGNTIFGQSAGTKLTSASQNTLIGLAVASTTLATGAGNVVIGTANNCDTATSSTNNTIRICTNGGLVWSMAGGATPSTSTTTIAGNLTDPGATITFSGVTTGTNADFVCMAAGGVLTLQTSACTISSLRFKDVLGELSPDRMVADIMALHPLEFKMKRPIEPNADPNYDRPQIGLTAENVASVDPRLSIYDDDMKTPKSYRQEGVIAALVVTAQYQEAQIRHLQMASIVAFVWLSGLTYLAMRRRGG